MGPGNNRQSLACQASIQAVINEANLRKDILPDYHLEVETEDEGPETQWAPRKFFRFLNQDRPNGMFLSPIVLGTTTQCQTIAPSLRWNYFTQMSEQCNGPYLVENKKTYSNLYRFLQPSSLTTLAMLSFFKHVGNWKQVGILSVYANPNDFVFAQILRQISSESGIDVVHMGLDDGTFTDAVTMMELKRSQARIVSLIATPVRICVAFLCQAHRHGLKSPQYLFVLQFKCYFLPNGTGLKLPQGCTKEMILEQIKVTIWIGYYRGSMQTSNLTSLGYKADWFNNRVDRLLNYSKVSDDDNRSICHDVALGAVVTLNNTESKLRRFYNFTLKDFKSNPSLIRKLLNESAANMDFIGLRIGKIKYSKFGELESDQQIIGQWDLKGQNLKSLWKIERLDDEITLNVSALRLISVNNPVWATQSGQNPPKDLSQIVHLKAEMPLAFAVLLACSSSLSLLFHLITATLLFRNARESRTFKRSLQTIYILGCILLNCGALAVASGFEILPGLYCYLLIVFPLLGLSFINLAMLNELFNQNFLTGYPTLIQVASNAAPGMAGLPELRIRKSSSLSQSKVPNHHRVQVRRGAERQLTVTVFFIIFALSMTWLSTEPISLIQNSSPVEFDSSLDFYFDISSKICSSPNMSIWVHVFAAVQACLLLPTCFFAYQLGHLAVPVEMAKHCRALRLAAVNLCSLFVVVTLILEILASSKPWKLSFALGVGQMAISSSSTFLLFFHLISSKPTLGLQVTQSPRILTTK